MTVNHDVVGSSPTGGVLKNPFRDSFLVRRACRISEVQVLCGHLLPVNPIATPKPDYREVAGRGRDSEIVALRIET